VQRVDRLIWREMLGPFLNGFFLFLSLLFGAAYLLKVTDLLVAGVPLVMVLRISLYSLAGLITQCLPMSMLLGSLLAFGRLSGDSEHIALFAGGVSFLRLARPVAAMGLVVSVITIAWNETVVPPAMRAYYTMVQEATQDLMATTTPLTYTIKRDDGSVDEYISISGGYDPKSKRLLGVWICKMSDDPKRKGQPEVGLYADWASRLGGTINEWQYGNVYVKSLKPDPEGRFVLDSFMQTASTRTLPTKNVRMVHDLRSLMQSQTVDNRQMTFRALRAKINAEREKGNYKSTLGDEVDLWEKLSLPLATMIFGLLGAPLGVRPQRSGKAVGFGIAISLIFLYWVIYRWMYVVGKSGGIPPLVASFSACFLGLLAAGWLVSRTRQ